MSEKLIVIGDIHGCLAQLVEVLDRCADFPAHRMVFLGDYIDGGSHSDEVISHLRGLDAVFLMGNHEASLIRVRKGIRGKIVPTHEHNPPAVSDENFAWMESSLQRYHQTRGYIFVHAGLDPARPLADQTEQDLLWSRYQGDYKPFEPRIVYHGHTTVDEIERTGNRVNVNTGCGFGGRLTAVVLPEQTIIQSSPSGNAKVDMIESMRNELQDLADGYPHGG